MAESASVDWVRPVSVLPLISGSFVKAVPVPTIRVETKAFAIYLGQIINANAVLDTVKAFDW